MSYITHMIRDGRTYEYESSRETHRIQQTRRVLETLGVDFTPKVNGETITAHTDDCNRSARNLANVAFSYRDRLVCNCAKRNARPELPTWLTDEIIIAAANLVDLAITTRAGKVAA